jgi:hypothetical protein
MNLFTETEEAKKSGGARQKAIRTGTTDLEIAGGRAGLEKRYTSMSGALTDAANPPKTTSQNRQERRRQRRAGVKVLVRLRPGDSRDEKFEEVLGTRNASRANLYVISASRCYYKMMPLLVTFPFNSAHDSASTMEDTAEVVRLDHLPDGRVGVAILFRKPAATADKKSGTAEKSNQERRFAIRHAVSASAKLTDWQANTRLQARCSDLSVAGCYIDTLNPFTENTSVHLQLINNQKTLEVDAHVISSHVGMGMGLVFDRLSPEQTLVLVDWLSKRSAPPLLVGEHLEAAAKSTVPEVSGTSDRALIIKLLRLLEAGGKLTRTEISELLCVPVDV